MKEEVEYALSKLSDAVSRLREGAAQASDDLERDGVIQRFEFTFELLWKSLKIFLEKEGIPCSTPRNCLKSAFRIGLIENEEIVLQMLEDRNKMSHLYDQEESRKIFQKIKSQYLAQIETTLNKLKDSQGSA